MNSSVISISIVWDIDEDDSIAELLVARKVLCIDVAPGKYIRTYPDFDQDRVLRIRKWWNSRGIEIIGMQGLLFGVRDAFYSKIKIPRKSIYGTEEVFWHCEIAWSQKTGIWVAKKSKTRLLKSRRSKRDCADFFCRVGDMAHAYGVCLY